MRRKIGKTLAVHGTDRVVSNCDEKEGSLGEGEKISNMLTIYFT